MNQKLSKASKSNQTCEFVSRGHVDKLCDQVSDAVLDNILTQDKTARVACETFITRSLILVGGEITTTARIAIEEIARSTVEEAGYKTPGLGFDPRRCTVLNVVGQQSPDIAQGVDQDGAGDQGIMIGYATDETESFMPLVYDLARKLILRQEEVRNLNSLDFLGPDAKSQVTLEFDDLGHANNLKTVVFSTQHNASVLDPQNNSLMSQKAKEEIIATIILPVLPSRLVDRETEIFINPTGKFLLGGPAADTGLTGRKLCVDQYGPMIPVGGGAFSGKDPSKVDRSGAYMMRYLAKNIVAAGIARKCIAQVAYAIGQKYPVAFELNFKGTGLVPEEEVAAFILSNFDLSPQEIINYLDLRKPFYLETARHGHFGFSEFSWEKLALMHELKARFKDIEDIEISCGTQYLINLKEALKALGALDYAQMSLENMKKVTSLFYYKTVPPDSWLEKLREKTLREAKETYKNFANPEKEALEELYIFVLTHNKTAVEYEKQKLISKGNN